MWEDGYENITSIDYSEVVIRNMQQKYRDLGENFKCIYFWI